jgi:hypothetical protein
MARPLDPCCSIHGRNVPVIAIGQALAAERLTQLGAKVTTDRKPALGHTINRVAEDVLVRRPPAHRCRTRRAHGMQGASG